jgi:hypothetical protein
MSSPTTNPGLTPRPGLLRQFVIRCLATGRTDTGYELTQVPSVQQRRQVLVDCLECGQNHEWRIEDSLLA